MEEPMLSVVFSQVRDDEVDRLRAWGRELMERTDEVKETFRQEGVRHEMSHLIRTTEGWVLIRSAEVDDMDKALAAFEASNLKIDAEHGDVMQQTLEGPFPAELIFECSL
jgi:hypothetical protein